MKPKWVATLNARKLKAVLQCINNLGTVYLMSLALVILSCNKSDDLETFGSESPIPIEPPVDTTGTTDKESVIIYTDLEQDFTGQNLNDSYSLDLNNDQIIDFIVSSYSSDGYEWLGIASNTNTANRIISVIPWYTHPAPLNSGEEIFNLRGYRNGEIYEAGGIFIVGDCFGGETDCSYNWKDKSDKYLGLRFLINGQTHYGWARLEITSITNWILKDYAYNATPNMPILAGQRN